MLTGYMDAVGIWYVFRLLNLKLSRNPLKVFYMRYDRYSIQEPPEGVLHEIRSLFHPVQLTFIRGRLHGCCWYLIAIPCHEICCMHNQLIWFVWSVFQCSLRLFGPVTWMLLVSDMFSWSWDTISIPSRNPLKVYYMRSVVCITNWFVWFVWSVCLVMRYDRYSIQCSSFIRGRLHGCCWYLIAIPCHEICCMHNQLIWFDLSDLFASAAYVYSGPVTWMLLVSDRYSIQEPPEGVLHEIRSLFHPVQLTFIRGRLHGCCWYLICFPIT